MRSLREIMGEGTSETLPCARCTNPNEVSQSTIEFARDMNAYRKQQGIPMVQKDKIALCSYCYGIHRAEQEAARNRDIDHDNELWREWLSGSVFDTQRERRLFTMMRNPEEFRDLKYRVLEKRKGRSEPNRQKGMLR